MLQSHEVMRGILLIFGLVSFMGVNGQTDVELFSDDFDRAGPVLDEGWTQLVVDASDAGNGWWISPNGSCTNDLRFVDATTCNTASENGEVDENNDIIVYHSVDVTGYNNVRLIYDWESDNTTGLGQNDADVSTSVVSTNASDWTTLATHEDGSGTNFEVATGLENGVIYIGFRVASADGGALDTDDNVNKLIIENVSVIGDTILPTEGTFYMTNAGDDPTDIESWYIRQDNPFGTDDVPEQGQVQSQFTNPNNTFVLAQATFSAPDLVSGDIVVTPAAASFSFDADWSVANLTVFAGSDVSNDGADLDITSSISIEAGATYYHSAINQGGGEKTDDFPFHELLNDELVGKVVLSNSGGAGFENEWDLTGDLDWSASGVIENNGELIITGSGTLEIDSLVSNDVNASTKIAESGAYLSISSGIDLMIGTLDHFQLSSDPASSGFIIQDGATFSGEVNIDANMGVFSMNRIILEDNATAYWHSGDGLNFTGGITVEEVNNDANASFQLVENLELGAGDTLDVQVGVSLQADEVITLSSGSHLTMNKGTIDSVSIGAGACFSVSTPTASALGHGGILVQANGVFYVEDGASLIQNSGNIVVAGGPTPFTQGGDFVDLDATGSAWGGAPSVSISNNIGWTDWSHYTYWSCPITNIPISIPSAVSIYEYTDNEDELGTGWVGPQSANFEAGRGYAVQQAGGGLVTFEGTCNTGNINGPEIGDDQGAVADGNWSLIGNPYPSAINGFLLVDAHPEILGALYIWDQSDFDSEFSFATNDYSVVNGTGVASGGRGLNDTTTIQGYYIPPFQAFFVTGVEQPVLASNTPVVFTNSMRDTTLVDTEHNHSFKSNSKQRLWIELFEYDQEEAEITECLIGFLPEATNGFDRMYDATNNNDGLNISSVIEVLDSVGNVRDKMSLVIQGRGELVIGDIVDLELEILHPGPYQLDIRKLENFDNQEIWIRDELLGVSHLLSQEPYIFQVNEAGLYDLQLMFHEPGTIGIEEEMVEAIPLDLKRKSGKWESNLDGEVVITTMAGQLLNQFDVKAKQPFAIEEDKGFFHFKSNDGQFKRWMLK